MYYFKVIFDNDGQGAMLVAANDVFEAMKRAMQKYANELNVDENSDEIPEIIEVFRTDITTVIN